MAEPNLDSVIDAGDSNKVNPRSLQGASSQQQHLSFQIASSLSEQDGDSDSYDEERVRLLEHPSSKLISNTSSMASSAPVTRNSNPNLVLVCLENSDNESPVKIQRACIGGAADEEMGYLDSAEEI